MVLVRQSLIGKMGHDSLGCRSRSVSNQPVEPFPDFFPAHLSKYTGDNLSLLVKKGRGRDRLAHVQPLQVVCSRSDPNWEANLKLVEESWNLFLGFLVIH